MRRKLTQPVVRDASIVVTGAFNPTIFHPSWFLREDLISERDVDESSVELIHRELSRFSLGQGSVEVTPMRFQVRTRDEGALSTIRDLVISTFTILSHTPVENLGINSLIEFQMPDEETWHKVGDALVNKTIWVDSLKAPVRLQAIALKSERNDDLEGYVQVRVLGAPNFGVKLDINNHIVIPGAQAASLGQILTAHWDRLQTESQSMAIKTMERCLK